MPRFAANLSTLFTEWVFLDRFAAAADAGFTAVEFHCPYAVRPDLVASRLQRTGLQPVMFQLPAGDPAAGEYGFAALPDRFEDLKASVATGVAYAKAIGARKLQMMAGVGDLQDPKHLASFRRALAYAAEQLGAEGIELLVEPLDARTIPGYFLVDFSYAANLAGQLRYPNFKVLFDIYQHQLAHGDVAMALRRSIRRIGHIQVAGAPDGGEPSESELNFSFLFKELEFLGYKGHIGCDYRPRNRSTLAGLGWFDPYAARIRPRASA